MGKKDLNDIKTMTLDELKNESSRLWTYLHMTEKVSEYDKFNWYGLDYWDAGRRHHEMSKLIIEKTFNL